MNEQSKVKRKTTAKKIRTTSIGWMIKSLSTKLDNEMLRELKPHGINLGQFAIIMVLLEEDNITQTEIGKKVVMPAYATTRNIDSLEKSGFLKRHENAASRRSFCIRLTKEGRLLAPILFPIVNKVNTQRLSTLSHEEKAQLKELLMKIL